MKKTERFYFNQESLSYVKYEPRFWERAAKVLAIASTFFVISILVYSIYLTNRKNPGEQRLRQEADFYKSQIEILNDRLQNLNTNITELKKRDNEIYRIIFETDPLPDNIGATGGVNSYDDLKSYYGSESIIKTYKRMETLSAEAKVLTQSYSKLLDLAHKKEKMLSSIPAIQPIANKNLSAVASGYGRRIHPIYKTLKMHEGLDFAAPRGTDVFATGDGVVEYAGKEGGYGNLVVINHGFGYKTYYGHLSKFNVRKGQKIKRGAMIAKVGSTGISTGPHLHYEVEINGKKVNPINFFHNDLTAAEYEKLIKLANQSNQSFD